MVDIKCTECGMIICFVKNDGITLVFEQMVDKLISYCSFLLTVLKVLCVFLDKGCVMKSESEIKREIEKLKETLSIFKKEVEERNVRLNELQNFVNESAKKGDFDNARKASLDMERIKWEVVDFGNKRFDYDGLLAGINQLLGNIRSLKWVLE